MVQSKDPLDQPKRHLEGKNERIEFSQPSFSPLAKQTLWLNTLSSQLDVESVDVGLLEEEKEALDEGIASSTIIMLLMFKLSKSNIRMRPSKSRLNSKSCGKSTLFYHLQLDTTRIHTNSFYVRGSSVL